MSFAIWELLSIDDALILILVGAFLAIFLVIGYVYREPIEKVPDPAMVRAVAIAFLVCLGVAFFAFYPVTYVQKNQLMPVKGKFHSAGSVAARGGSNFEIFLNDRRDSNGYRPLSSSIAKPRVQKVMKGEQVKLLIGDYRIYEMQSAGKVIFGYQESVDHDRKYIFYWRFFISVAIFLLGAGLVEFCVRKLMRKRLLKNEIAAK